MAFTDEALKAKLSTLNESQDSIVSVSQWIMFHRRHADRIASFWLQRLRDSSAAKRLNLLYLVNEIVQNSRARRKDDFPNAFSPIMPEAAQTAYRSSTTEVQQKIRRLIEVWRSRNVFEVPIQDAIEARLEEIDKTRPAGKKQLMGSSLFGSSSGSGGLPKELESLAQPQLAVSKAHLSTTSTVNIANSEYAKLNDPDVQLPAPPLHAARLSALLKTLAIAESSASESIRARKSLISELEKILEANRSSLATEETSLQELQSRKEAMETNRRDVEDNIRRTANAESDGMYNNISNSHEGGDGFDAPGQKEIDRPEYEALTPPPVEAFTPVGSPRGGEGDHQTDTFARRPDLLAAAHTSENHNPDVRNLLASMSSSGASAAAAESGMPPHAGLSHTANLGMGVNGFGGGGSSSILGSTSKKRKMNHSGSGAGELPLGFGVEVDLDEDVAEMIRQESGGGGSGDNSELS